MNSVSKLKLKNKSSFVPLFKSYTKCIFYLKILENEIFKKHHLLLQTPGITTVKMCYIKNSTQHSVMTCMGKES